MLETEKQWQDGLQQFLEMKHQVDMSDMTTVTNFMSNFHFFKRYAKNLGVYGVTGTMGGDAGKEFMQKHFKVNDRYQLTKNDLFDRPSIFPPLLLQEIC